jgi:hypothetical protein
MAVPADLLPNDEERAKHLLARNQARASVILIGPAAISGAALFSWSIPVKYSFRIGCGRLTGSTPCKIWLTNNLHAKYSGIRT